MTRKNTRMGIMLLILGFAAGVGFSSIALSQRSTDDTVEPRPVVPRGGLTQNEESLTALFEEASPSVVYITSLALRRDFFRLNVMEIPQGTGSGFVWDTQGHIVTNFHVIEDADRAEVTLADGSTWEAALVGYAPEKDLAVLKIDAPTESLQAITVGSSGDLKVGQTVLAIGNPFGFDQTLTTGIVSALGREIESDSDVPIRDVIQTDAAINPGNSGGPLLDSAGRLIGVNTAIVSPSGGYAGVGFAIPVDTVNWVVPELIAYGKVQRPTLGLEFASDLITRRIGIEGALVIDVEPGSGADRAGLKQTYRDRSGRVILGDVVVAIDGTEIRSKGEVPLALEGHKEGDEVEIKVDRGGQTRTLRVVLGKPK